MKIFSFTLFVLCGLFSICFAADCDSLLVEEIVIIGNDKTRGEIIRREMDTRVGCVFDLNTLQKDRQRIQNLRLFNQVTVEPICSDSGITVLVVVVERWYIFPYPIFYANERDWKKSSYGAGVVYRNFRGRNTDIGLSGWWGYNPGFSAYYSNPWFSGKAGLFMTLEAFSETIRSKTILVQRFDQKIKGGSLQVGRRWGHHTFTSAVFSYQTIRFPESYSRYSQSQTGLDHLPSVALVFRYDNRNDIDYAKDGFLVRVYADNVYYPQEIRYLKTGAVFCRYQPLGKDITLAGRLACDGISGDAPVYAQHYLGYSERIRGYYQSRRQGRYRLLAGLELRLPLVALHHIDMEGYITDTATYALPFAVHGALFIDSGAVWNRVQAISKSDFLTGFGAGIHVQLPYSYVLRFDVAFNRNNHKEFIFDLGAWF